MIHKSMKTHWRVFLGLLSVAVLLALYTRISYKQHQENPDDTTIPTWTQLWEGVKQAVGKNPRSGERWLVEDSLASMKRLFLGLFYGIAGALVIGLLMGCFKTCEAFFAPPVLLLAKVPPTAALAVFFVMCKTEMNMFVAMIAFGVLPSMGQSIYLAVRDVPDEMLYKAATLGASRVEIIWNVIVRAILPKMLDAVRLQIGPAIVYLIAAEMIVGDVGFGYRIRLQMRLLNMSVVYPYIAVLAAFGFVLDYALRLVQRRSCPWYAGEHE